MKRFLLFTAAVVVLYFGGFAYDEVGPLLYSVVLAIIASTPLLLKISFWKKILLMVPLLVLRVVGKVFLTVFGKNALSKLLAKYGLLEARFNRTVEALTKTKDEGIVRWKNMRRSSQAYLILIFFPLAVVLFILTLVIKIVRLRFLQFIVEKIMQSFLMKWATAVQPKLSEQELQKLAQKKTNDQSANEQLDTASGKSLESGVSHLTHEKPDSQS